MKRELYTTINETNCNSWEFILPIYMYYFQHLNSKKAKPILRPFCREEGYVCPYQFNFKRHRHAFFSGSHVRMDISLLYLFQSKSLSQFQRNPSLCRFSLFDMSYVAFSMPYMSIDRILPNFYIAEARHFSFCLIECTCPKILRYPKTRQVTSLLPNIIVPGFILIVSVENIVLVQGVHQS